MKTKKHRRPRGSGTVYQIHRPSCSRPKTKAGQSTCRCIWWIAYRGHDGLRHAESSESHRKSAAELLLSQKVGARENNLPVIPKAQQLLFNDAAKAVLDDFRANGKRSLVVVERRLKKHLTPYFGGRRMVAITMADVTAYVAHRQEQGIERKGKRVADVSNAEINRELQILKRIFSLAIKSGRLALRPHIPMLREDNARSGFFEPEQLAAVVKHLPAEIAPVIEFASITGWRIASEVLPLEWRQVDFDAGEVRLDPGTTKNGEGRVFPMTSDLRTLLKDREAERDRLKKAGYIVSRVFFREVAEGRGGKKKPRPIVSFHKAWETACAAAGCPGRIPHDLRRTAVRHFVRRGIPERVAMTLSGHKTRSVFERYNIVSKGDLKTAAERLNEVESWIRRGTARS